MTSTEQPDTDDQGRRGGTWLRPALITAILAAVIAAFAVLDLKTLLISGMAWIQDLGWIGIAAYIGIYVLACVLMVPGSIITLGAGFVYGVVHGTILVSVASTTGATIAFLVGRYLARNWVSRRIQGNQRFRAIDEAVAREGWKIVGLTRLSPIFPFNLLNYGFGLTRVRLKDYVLASWIGMLPGTIMYVYAGSVSSTFAGLAPGAERGKSTAEWILYGVGLLATVAVTVYVTRIAKKALTRKLSDE